MTSRWSEIIIVNTCFICLAYFGFIYPEQKRLQVFIDYNEQRNKLMKEHNERIEASLKNYVKINGKSLLE